MMKTNERSELLLGKKALETLNDKTVLVVGVGGVGSFCVEALARTGVGHLILIDKDCVEPSNINRQLVATLETVDQVKVDVLKKRIGTLNPNCIVDTFAFFYDQTKDDEIFSQPIDFVVDCIDSIQSKKDLMQACIDRNIPFLSSMGMARRKDPTKLVVTEVEKTSYDPMAKQIRQWKRKNRIRNKIWVVASLEQPIPVESGQPLPSAIFVPASAGLVLASECVQRLIDTPNCAFFSSSVFFVRQEIIISCGGHFPDSKIPCIMAVPIFPQPIKPIFFSMSLLPFQ